MHKNIIHNVYGRIDQERQSSFIIVFILIKKKYFVTFKMSSSRQDTNGHWAAANKSDWS